ncbi:MAG: sigma 54-interacting transcriptional regulator [Desulfuromonadales bacterium]|nr:sigma 54-interacting transcriptional regulator [Desulfuromonadales bacterium]
MNRLLRILIIDDSDDDALLLLRALKKGGFAPQWARVENAKDMQQAMANGKWDVAISDCHMPEFSAEEALAIWQSIDDDLPFVVISGAIGEEDAVALLKAGAHDFIRKENLARLVPAILRQLGETKERKGRRQAEKILRESEEKYRLLFSAESDAIVILDAETRDVVEVNKAAAELYGYSTKEFSSLKSSDVSAEPQRSKAYFDEISVGGISRVPLINHKKKDGTIFPSEISGGTFMWKNRRMFVLIIRDISERIRRENELKNALGELEEIKKRLEAENVYLKEEFHLNPNFSDIVGQGKTFKKVLLKVEQVAVTDTTVLLLGETGTGKELLARAIHNLSPRKDHSLVKVNCAALPANLIESELFGHEKGSFTGATARKFGRFELANGGTIFLDEIGDLPLELQSKLLRVLQEGELERVGGMNTIKVDVRVIAATNRELENAMAEGTFREDLYYRLNVFPIKSPPLRERREDIPALVKFFIQKHGPKLRRQIKTIPKYVMDTLKEYHWPGNVRELENIIERSLIHSQGDQLTLGDYFRQAVRTPKRKEIRTLADMERENILEALEATSWRVSGKRGAAEILGLKPTTLEARMKKLGIKRKGV